MVLVIHFLPIVDNLAPEMTIILPTNNSVYNLDAPNFKVVINERSLHKMWYTLDGGLNNYTFSTNGTINQLAWDSLPYASVNLQFYAMDKTGKMGSAEVIIIKELQKTEEIPGFNLIILISIISMISVILVKERQKKKI
jgi:hypothetical protein